LGCSTGYQGSGSDLGEDPAYATVRGECEMLLRRICDPDEVDGRAKRRQAEQVVRHGGRDAVIARGDLGYSPPPGHKADFR
jgi:choline-sulfatase